MITEQDAQRYQANWQSESESAMLYRLLADYETNTNLADIYRKLAETEERHRDIWAKHLQDAGKSPGSFRPGWQTKTLSWMAKRFGTHMILPVISSLERSATTAYDQEPEAKAAGMPAQERFHARVFQTLLHSSGSNVSGPMLAQFEGRHRTGGGNALRAAVLGASDGLTSNMSLVMGVAGATLTPHTVILTGFAGLFAGALSMAIGEWLSVQSARELYESQIAVEKEELASNPAEEAEELALIYQAKGIDEATAKLMANNIMQQGDIALDTLVREELSLDPQELGGSAITAALTSFFLFATGAIIPVIPFFFGASLLIVAISLLLSTVGLFVIGVGISLTTGVPLLKAGGRQIVLGLAAALVTFSLGRLVGGHLR